MDYGIETGHDLSSCLAPPKELNVTVRVLKDAGEVVLDSGGVINLTKGTTHFVRRGDVEALIREGVVEQIDEEES